MRYWFLLNHGSPKINHWINNGPFKDLPKYYMPAWDRELDWCLDASDANIVNFVLIAKNSKDRNLLKAYVCDISYS